MRFPRSSGIVLHISSLPGRYGIGDLGPAARAFVDFLERTKQSLWQMLPTGPTGYGNSPYQCVSAFAGNPLFISLEDLVDERWLTSKDIPKDASFSAATVDFDRVIPWRRERLLAAGRRAASKMSRKSQQQFAEFQEQQADWLVDHALYIAVKEAHQEKPWTEWASELARREPAALRDARERLADRIHAETFLQFQFARQWDALRRYAAERGVRIVGDMPIFVAHDSADVWAHQELFSLDASGRPMVVAGVPPDYFSSTGQLWGNPLYRWNVLAERGYDWWVKRFRHAFQRLDLVRIDHFRGFEAYWEVPGGAPDASSGRWAAGPGIALFRAAERELGPLPLIAEDLGVITPQVEALRDELGAPGMRVLQFAFGDDAKAADYRPHNYPRHCVVYTGTHDNDTTVGWFRSAAGAGTTRNAEQIARERAHLLAYVGTDGNDIHWDMLRLAWGSVADTAIAPLQDVLGLGTEARMNLPGSLGGNWTWRFTADEFTPHIESRLRSLTEVFERAPLPAAPVAESQHAPSRGAV